MEVGTEGIDIGGIRFGVILGGNWLKHQTEKSVKYKGIWSEFWYAGSLQKIIIVATNWTQILPNPVKLWIVSKKITEMVLEQKEVEETGGRGGGVRYSIKK